MRTTLITAKRLSLLSLVLLAGLPGSAAAQQHHTVRIQEGAVFVDGSRVPQDELPPSLRVDDVQLRLEFTGRARFHVNGMQYGLDGGRIVELPPDADDFVVYLDADAEPGFFVSQDGSGMARFRLETQEDGAIATYLNVLDEKARQFEEMGAELEQRQAENAAVLANRLRKEAEQTAVVVRAFPRVEVQTYLQGIQDRDRTLYDRLLREQRMEVASGELARRVFAARDETTRRSLTESLRGQLEEIFELKQQNRRDEIEQLEMQLRELREQLAARESNREAIIGKRMRALIGNLER